PPDRRRAARAEFVIDRPSALGDARIDLQCAAKLEQIGLLHHYRDAEGASRPLLARIAVADERIEIVADRKAHRTAGTAAGEGHRAVSFQTLNAAGEFIARARRCDGQTASKMRRDEQQAKGELLVRQVVAERR